MAALLFPFAFIAALELGLRLAGYGFNPHFFISTQSGGTPVLGDNPRFGWRFFPRSMARTPRPLSIPANRDSNTIRIVVLGESAAMGDPEPAFGFPRILETLLRAQFPGKRFEVINAAMTAINSNVILPIAQDCAAASADLWIVYMGNNEVVGPYGAGTVWGAPVPPLPLIRARTALGTTRIGQLAAEAASRLSKPGGHNEAWGGMEMFLSNQLHQGDPRMAAVYNHFEQNLRSIIETGERAGARVILCTVGSNLADCPPFGSGHPAEISSPSLAEWDTEYHLGSAAQEAGQTAEAMGHFSQALKLDAEFAELHFRMGQCLQTLGRYSEARSSFETARDLDTLRFRADSRINGIIRQTAQLKPASSGLQFLDAEQLLAASATNGLAGESLFVDHVHLTFAGNYLLSLRMAVAAAQRLNLATENSAALEWLSLDDCAKRLGWSDWSKRLLLEDLRQRFRRPPFTGQLGHDRQMQRLSTQIEDLQQTPRPNALAKASADYKAALLLRPDDWVLHEKLGEALRDAGDYPSAIAQWETVVRQLPRYAGVYNNLGIALNSLGKPAEAEFKFHTALSIDPEMVEAINGLGLAYAQQRRLSEAMAEFQRALRIKPNYVATYVNLALALEASGQVAAAAEQCRAALLLFPSNAIVHANLGRFLASQGQTNEALVHLQESVRLAPGNATAHFNLGNLLLARGNEASAIAEFTSAARLDPRGVETRINLAVCLLRSGQASEAAAYLSQAIAINPNSAKAHMVMGILLEQQQRFAEAASQFEETLRLEPNNATAKRHLSAAGAGRP